MSDQKTPTSSAADRKNKVTGALMDIRAFAGKQLLDEDGVCWPLILVDAVLKSESAGDPDRQDELIDSIGVLLKLGTEEYLTIPEAANRLAGERTRALILGSLHGAQVNAEVKVQEAKAALRSAPDPDSRVDWVAQSRHHEGEIAALAYAIELVNASELPGDNDQQIGELVTPEEARIIEHLIWGEGAQETAEQQALRRRLHRLAESGR